MLLPATRVLRTLCFIALCVTPACALFAPSVNPIPLAALQITYKSVCNAWEFVDRYAMPYEGTVVLLCAAPASSACGLAELEFTGKCAELAAHPVLAAAAWRNVDAAPDACLRAPVINASMRSAPPNRLLLDNNFTALRRFDTANSSADGGIVLRVRFVYLQGLAGNAVHLRSAGYSLVLAPLQDAPHAVHVQTECGARGFSAPDYHLPPAQGGAELEVHLATVDGRPEHLCTWQCQLPYLKMPWNTAALSEAQPTTTGRCAATPAFFTTVALSFAVRYPASERMRWDSAQTLLGLDQMADAMAVALSPRFGELTVLLSVRNSSVNPREVGEVFALAQKVGARTGFDLEMRDNSDYNLAALVPFQAARRLLAADTAVFVVDGVVVAARSDIAACCLADEVVQAQQSVPPTAYDLNVANSTVERPQIHSVVFVTQNSYQETLVLVQPPPEQSASFSPLFLLFVALLVLLCICMCQKDGFSKNEQEYIYIYIYIYTYIYVYKYVYVYIYVYIHIYIYI